jgi:5-formyltetrahydrofolate cyclo-ligase
VTAHPPSKSALRQSFMERRLQLLPNDRVSAAEAVSAAFFQNVPLKAETVVAGYWPIKAELDALLLMRALLGKGHKCALPHVTGEGAPLLFRNWDENTPMVTGKYGLTEPANHETLLPDIILVPVLAFDATGHRLGYGMGFYDRTLARLKKQKPIRAIGLAYEMQLYNGLPVEANDVKMDMIITDRNVYA